MVNSQRPWRGRAGGRTTEWKRAWPKFSGPGRAWRWTHSCPRPRPREGVQHWAVRPLHEISSRQPRPRTALRWTSKVTWKFRMFTPATTNGWETTVAATIRITTSISPGPTDALGGCPPGRVDCNLLRKVVLSDTPGMTAADQNADGQPEIEFTSPTPRLSPLSCLGFLRLFGIEGSVQS
jgi:hypothetical protein